MLLGTTASFPQTRTSRDGHPDFQGTWASATLTALERTAEFSGRPAIPDDEARAWARRDHPIFEERQDLSPAALKRRRDGNAVGAEQSETWERGSNLARVNGQNRTSLVVDPPDGRVPALTAAARQTASAVSARSEHPRDIRDLGLTERCVTYLPIPITPQLYNGNYQIIQTPDYLMILSEMIHDARIIRINGTHSSPATLQWHGDSVARWDGETLVIDTIGFNDRYHFRGSGQKLHIVERLSRPEPGILLYKATIDDPDTFTAPWTIEYPLTSTTGKIFEYACHEGNASFVESTLNADR